MSYNEYEVHMDLLPEDAVCVCPNCNWNGGHDEAYVIGIAVLMPGDPSPAGRCPKCDQLVYPAFQPAPECAELIDKLKDAALDATRKKDKALYALLDRAAGTLQALLE